MAATSPTNSEARGVAQPATRQFGHRSSAAALTTLYTLTLRQHLRGRRWMVMVGLFLLPIALAVVLRIVASMVPLRALEFMIVFMLMPQALLPLIALVYASGIIRDEQEEQTLTYLLVRPIPKWAMYCAKLLATMTMAVAIVVVFTILTYVAIYVGAGPQAESVTPRCITAAGLHALAVVAYCSLFGLISIFTRRVLLAGVVYTAIFEGLLANFPFGIRLITVIYYARIIAYRSLSFSVELPSGQTEDPAALLWQLNVQADPILVEHPLSSTCFAVLIGASVVCTALAAWLCSSREFHVKTPESA